MKYAKPDSAVLTRDVPERGPRTGDLGALVELYPTDTAEVEFVTASGRTEALVTLEAGAVPAIEDTDLVAVPSRDRSA